MHLSQFLIGVSACSLLTCGCQSIKPLDPATPTPATGAATAAPHPTAKKSVNFAASIEPILSNKCTICHNSQVMPSRPYFETREGALKSGMIVPGKPETSRILTVIQEDPAKADKAMPPVSHRLSKSEVSLLRTWIAEGADWPAGEAGRIKPAFIPQE